MSGVENLHIVESTDSTRHMPRRLWTRVDVSLVFWKKINILQNQKHKESINFTNRIYEKLASVRWCYYMKCEALPWIFAVSRFVFDCFFEADIHEKTAVESEPGFWLDQVDTIVELLFA